MKSKPDPFDGQLSLPPEFLPTYAQPYVPPARRRRRAQFALFPMWWLERLVGAEGRTLVLAVHILHRYWRNKHRPFKLSTFALADYRFDKAAKSRALAELERRGLVMVERFPSKNPVVEPVLVAPEALS
jgi:hypothetical protein